MRWDGVGVRSALLYIVRVGYGMMWFGVWGRVGWGMVRGICVVQ